MINLTVTARKCNSAALGTYMPPHWYSKALRSISERLEANCIAPQQIVYVLIVQSLLVSSWG